MEIRVEKKRVTVQILESHISESMQRNLWYHIWQCVVWSSKSMQKLYMPFVSCAEWYGDGSSESM